MSESGGQKRRIPVWVHTIIFFAIMLGFAQIPAPEPMTQTGMKAVGIFAGLIYAYITIGIIWPSVAGMIAMVELGVMSVDQVFASGWGGTVTTLMLFMMMIAYNLQASGISRIFALWSVSRKVVIGRPWMLSYFFLFVIAAVSSLTSSVAMVFLGWAILQDMMEVAQVKKFEGYSNYMMIGVVMASCLGSGLFSFRAVGAIAFGVMEKVSGAVLNDAVFAVWEYALCLILLAFYVLMGKYVFKIDASKIGHIDRSYFENMDLSLNRAQKWIICLMIFLVFCMLIPSIMPNTWVFLEVLGTNGTAALIVLLMCVIRVDDKPLMEPRSAIRDGVSFDVLFLSSATLPLAADVFASQDAGVSAYLSKVLAPMMRGASGIVFLVIVALIAVLLANVLTNATVPAILFPAFYPIATAVGVGPVELMCTIVFCSGLSFMLPSATPMIAVMYNNKEWIRTKDIFKYAGSFLIVCFTVLCLELPVVQIIFP